jgi:hypothetical protein
MVNAYLKNECIYMFRQLTTNIKLSGFKGAWVQFGNLTVPVSIDLRALRMTGFTDLFPL